MWDTSITYVYEYLPYYTYCILHVAVLITSTTSAHLYGSLQAYPPHIRPHTYTPPYKSHAGTYSTTPHSISVANSSRYSSLVRCVLFHWWVHTITIQQQKQQQKRPSKREKCKLEKTNRQQQKQPQATICEANEKRKLLKTHRHIAYLLSFLLWALKPDLSCSSPYSHSLYPPSPGKLTTPSKRRRPPMTEFEAHSQSPYLQTSSSLLSCPVPPTGCACHAKRKIWIIYLLRQ